MSRYTAGYLRPVLVWALLIPGGAPAAPPSSPQAAVKRAPPSPEPPGGDKLAAEQQRIAERFKRFEAVLLRMAEVTAPADPRRAALLKKTVAQSKESLIAVRLDTLAELVKKDQLSRAIGNQPDVDRDLRALLDLLQSENRSQRLESEKARLREYLKRINELIQQQKGIQGLSLGKGEPARLAGDQGRLADKTGQLAKEVQAGQESKAEAGKSQGGEKGQGRKGAEADGERKPKPGGTPGPSSGKSPSADKPQPAPPGPPSRPGSPSQGQGTPQDQPSAPQGPALQRLQSAQQRMREAQQKLEQAQRQGAADKQEQAIRELERAKANLEKTLRQLREEEMERTLALLESRFLKMLQAQKLVYEGTQRLDKVPAADRNHNQEIDAGRLSGQEADIVGEADKALVLLRQEGSAVAFPEVLAQVRQDMQQIVDRLARALVDPITQGIEKDVIAALEDMLQAVQQARKNLEDQKRPPPPGQAELVDPPLVDLIAELKMIRTLQIRVRARTRRYSELVEGEEARHQDLIEALHVLAQRQRQIQRITRDLATGKNR
jgi:hypothetical protein